jgi:DNA-binding GntR family transcriptional regulator
MEPITRNNLSDQIFERISGQIIRNELKPGEIIYETQISKDLGVSRSPVRDALHMLEQIRLVDKTPKGSYQVTTLTPELIASLYDTAIILYQYAFAKAAKNAGAGDLAEMEKFVAEIENSLGDKALDRYLTNVSRMARVILRAAGNPIVERIALELMPTAERVQWTAMTYLPEQMSAIVGHLRQGYVHIAAGNPDAAAKAFYDFATRHITIVLNAVEMPKRPVQTGSGIPNAE